MDTLETPDPYISHYIYEKTVNPQAKLYWKAYRKRQVDMANKIVELAHGEREVVKSGKDWEIVGELLKFFATEWPGEYKQFESTIPDIRASRRAGGYSESGEIRYVGALPLRFMKMIQVIFPFQQFDKQFVNNLVKRIPVLRVGGVNNMSKGRSII